MCLMAINRVAGLVLPYISKTLLDKVLSPTQPHPELLPRDHCVGLLGHAGAGYHFFLAYAIALEGGPASHCRNAPPGAKHVGLLSVAYYDENRTGTLVSRIMTDVEGVRNLVGTGLVEFVGGMLTAVLAFLYLMHRSPTVTLTVSQWWVGSYLFCSMASKIFVPSSGSGAKSTRKLPAG